MNQKVGLRTFRVYTLISAILTKSGLTNGETVSLKKPYNFAYIPTLIKS